MTRQWNRHLGPSRALFTAVAIAASLMSSIAGAQSLPGPPGSPAIAIAGRTATISWAPPTTGDAPTSYLIAAGTRSLGTDLGVHDVGSGASVGPLALDDGVYYVRVLAANAAGTGPASEERVFVIGGAVPGAPGTPVAIVAGTRVTLQWTAPVTGGVPTHYLVVAGTTLGSANLGTYNVGAATTVAAPLSPGTYCLRIMAANASGPGAPSGDACVTIGNQPGVPGKPSARTSNGVLTIDWNAPTSGGAPTRYLVAAGSAPGAIDLGIRDAGAARSLTTTAPPGTYFIRVIALNAAGQSSPSPELAMTIGETPALIAPVQDAVVRQNDSTSGCLPNATRGYGFRIAFDWADVVVAGDVAGYQLVLKHPGAINPVIHQHIATSELVFMSCDGYVAFNNRFGWEWRVRTFDSQGQYGPWSPVRLLHFGPCRLSSGGPCYANGDASGPPSSLSASVMWRTVFLTWGSPTTGGRPFGYVVEAGSLPGASNLARVSTDDPAPAYVARDVSPGRYFVRVRARTYGGTSAPSNEIVVDVP